MAGVTETPTQVSGTGANEPEVTATVGAGVAPHEGGTPPVVPPPTVTPPASNVVAEALARAEQKSLTATLHDLLQAITRTRVTHPQPFLLSDGEINGCDPEQIQRAQLKSLMRLHQYYYEQCFASAGSLQLIVVTVKLVQAMAVQLDGMFRGTDASNKDLQAQIKQQASVGVFHGCFSQNPIWGG